MSREIANFTKCRKFMDSHAGSIAAVDIQFQQSSSFAVKHDYRSNGTASRVISFLSTEPQ